MRALLNVLKYGLVVSILIIWFPAQYAVVRGVPQLLLAVVVAGYLLAILLLALSALSERLGVKLSARLSVWFWLIVPPVISLPLQLGIWLYARRHDSFYGCIDCGWHLFWAPVISRTARNVEVDFYLLAGMLAVAFYAILLVSSLFIKIMAGRS
ncbi:hypothetical protein [Bradyrhizobium sp. SRS-191]|uniref:hypothetical protein n=1 Tax=Bradyrhizobium sp. SRS-191 TaxID=2962606 RepID=UPI00211EA881|nr:hypothetical protein [Bradyrhizobium sp. SRS-191]